MGTIQYVLAGLAVLEKLAEAGASISGITSEMTTTLTAAQAEGRDPTPEERKALDDKITAELAALDAA